MDEEDAKSLVNKLINAVYAAGQHSSNPDSLIVKSEEKKALKLADEIRRHLTTKKCCPLCPQSREGKCRIDEGLEKADKHKKATPPRYDETYYKGQQELLNNN